MRRLNALLLLSAWYDTERAGEIATPVGAEYKGADGTKGIGGSVFFVPIFEKVGDE